jgi:MFS family permease
MAISFYYNIVVLYYAELFPSRAVALGGSVAAFGGSIGSIVVPLILGFIISLNYNPLMIYTIVGPLTIFIFFFLKETQGQPIQ